MRPTTLLTTFTSGLFLFGLGLACGPTDDGGGSGASGNGSGGADGSGAGNNGSGSFNFGTGGGAEECADGVVEACGDGLLTCSEACDDGNAEGGDGCAADCTMVEAGFTCPKPGEECKPFAKCGDGVTSFPEQCDDANTTPGEGCSASGKVEIGYKCVGAPSGCTETECGDFIVEAPGETCDDGNTIPFDGCDARCQAEPTCGSSGCSAKCGDGIVMPPEECDDGNSTSGDGCSDDCVEEEGYVCEQAPCEQIDGKCILRVPAVFRDFAQDGVEWQSNCGQYRAGVVNATLDADKKPTLMSNTDVCITSQTTFRNWYRDAPINSGGILGSIVLFENGEGGYVNRYGANGEQWMAPVGAPMCQANVNNNMPCPIDGNPLFFPLDDMTNPKEPNSIVAKIPQEVYGGGWNDDPSGTLRNFHFTSEVTYWFIHDSSANAKLTFVGDDDVWVFINNRLAVNLGGLHVPITGSIQLGATLATNFVSTDQNGSGTTTTRPIADFGLVNGNAYEIKVFHAERKSTGSSPQLTLANFDVSRSEWLPQCGDGIIGAGEECDDMVNDGGYNECQPGCVLGGYCGDGIRQENEACDDRDPEAPSGCSGCRIIVIK